jgi:FkbM family methyltransferase
MGLLQRLDQSPVFHVLLRGLRLKELAGLVLRRCPLTKTLPGSGVRYRCRYLETFIGADEIFHRNLYTTAIDPKNVTTFADLGCNVGLFAALLAHLTGRRNLQGIMIDANAEMVDETRWILSANQMDRVVAVHGLAGAAKASETAEFYLSTSNLGSSQFPVDEPGKSKKSDWKKVVVPRINLESLWLAQLGDVRCNVLKVDIEGSENDFFRSEEAFLRRVDRIVLEWHKWVVSGETVHSTLQQQGFQLVKVIDENDSIGVAWYRKN